MTQEKTTEEKFIVNLKEGNKEPVEDRIEELKDMGLNEDASIIIAIGER